MTVTAGADDVVVSVNQYALLRNASSTDAVKVDIASAITTPTTLSLSDAQDTVAVGAKPTTGKLTVEHFSVGKRGDVLQLTETDTALKASMVNLTSDYTVATGTITVADDTILLLKAGDVDLASIKFGASAANKAGVAVQTETGITVYTVSNTAAVLANGKDFAIDLAGVDLTDFVTGNLEITA